VGAFSPPAFSSPDPLESRPPAEMEPQPMSRPGPAKTLAGVETSLDASRPGLVFKRRMAGGERAAPRAGRACASSLGFAERRQIVGDHRPSQWIDGDVEARFTPDSKRILFRGGGHGEFLMLSLNGTVASMPAELTHGNAGIRGVSVSHDGQAIYFGGQQEYAKFGIWRIRQGDPAPVRITPEGMEAVSPAIDSLAAPWPSCNLPRI